LQALGRAASGTPFTLNVRTHNMSRRISTIAITLACILSWPITCRAGDINALAHQFVELLRYDEQFNNNRISCLENSKAVSPEALVAKDPDIYYGLRPNSPRWPAVLQAYSQYWETICSRPTKSEFLASLAAVYAKEMSVGQLKSAIQFYSSPVGQKLIATHRGAAAQVNSLFSQAYAEQVPQAAAEYNRRLKAIAEARK
jgi:hypothetical protein